jgi:phage baseplate assembly protein W
MTSDEEDIEASLKILLSTGLGERFLQPKYGLDLRDQIFEAMSRTAESYLKERVRNAILIYEPRIELQDLELDLSKVLDGVVALRLDYRVRTTNSRYNLVFPFYQSGDAIELRGRIPALRPPAA